MLNAHALPIYERYCNIYNKKKINIEHKIFNLIMYSCCLHLSNEKKVLLHRLDTLKGILSNIYLTYAIGTTSLYFVHINVHGIFLPHLIQQIPQAVNNKLLQNSILLYDLHVRT